MADIRPFRGLYYNNKKVRDLAKVIAPPYDVISKKGQDDLYGKSRHNFVKVILGKEKASDKTEDNKYSRASKYISSWIEENILSRDENESLYLYEQVFTYRKKKMIRKGFVGLLKLEDGTSVKIHENTFDKPKADRLDLMRSTQANTEPIFVVYNGEELHTPDEKPFMEIKDDKSVLHRIWKISDKEVLEKFLKDIQSKDIYMADGHHRFATAVNFARENGISKGSEDPKNFIMTYFVEQKNSGLVVMPIHRIMNISDDDADLLFKTAKKYFLIVEIGSFERVENSPGHSFGFINKKDGKLYLFKLRDAVAKDKIMKEKGREDLKDLDVAILHTLLLDDILEKNKDRSKEDVISFTHDEKEAINMVKKGKASCALLLNPTKVDQIMQIADIGGKMPQKSTFFYPKPYSGIVFRKFD